MKTKRTLGKMIPVLALVTMMASASEAQVDGNACKVIEATAKTSGEPFPERSATSAALIGAIGILMLLNRYRS